ncbi:MAG: hypothetical protein IRY95_03635 [Clostridia bacterium]|nr:hypothetical protein [Clostridia bacterium]
MAKAWLSQRGLSFREHHIFQDPPPKAVLQAIAAAVGGRADALLSRRSRSYREKAEALEGLSDKELLGALARDPGLLRRPLVLAPRLGLAVIGFDQEALQRLAEAVEAAEQDGGSGVAHEGRSP